MEDLKVVNLQRAYAVLKQVCQEIDAKRPQPKGSASKTVKANFPLLKKLIFTASEEISFSTGQGSSEKLERVIKNALKLLNKETISGFKIEVNFFTKDVTNWRERLNEALAILAPPEEPQRPKRERDADKPTLVSNTPSQISTTPSIPTSPFQSPLKPFQNPFPQIPLATPSSFFGDDTETIDITQFLKSEDSGVDPQTTFPPYTPFKPLPVDEKLPVFTTTTSDEVKEEKPEEDPDLQPPTEKKKKSDTPQGKLVFHSFFTKPQTEKTDDQPCVQLTPFQKHLHELNTKLSGKLRNYWTTYDLKHFEEALLACAEQAEALWEEEKGQYGFLHPTEVGTAKHARAEALLNELLNGKLAFWNKFVLIENLYLPSTNGQNFNKSASAKWIGGSQAQPASYPGQQNNTHNPWGSLEPDVLILKNDATMQEDVEAIYDFKFSGNQDFVPDWDSYNEKSPYNGDNQKNVYATSFRLAKDKVKRVHPTGIKN